MIQSTLAESYTVKLETGAHQFLSDVKPALGGSDQGPSPHELLEGALAACTSITVMMYAKRKSMPLKEIKVEVKTISEGAQNKFSRSIKLEGEVTAEDQAKLLDIANRCPVHKILSGTSVIETSVI